MSLARARKRLNSDEIENLYTPEVEDLFVYEFRHAEKEREAGESDEAFMRRLRKLLVAFKNEKNLEISSDVRDPPPREQREKVCSLIS